MKYEAYAEKVKNGIENLYLKWTRTKFVNVLFKQELKKFNKA